ncbi:unnamed protein product [Closterium sp. NIES-54]
MRGLARWTSDPKVAGSIPVVPFIPVPIDSLSDEIDGEDETLGLRSGQVSRAFAQVSRASAQVSRASAQRGPLCSYVAATALLLLGCGVGLGISALLSLLFPATSLRFISANAPPDALADAQSQLSFLVVGDWGRNGDYNQSIVAESMGEVAAAIDSSFVVSTGDNFYDDGMQDINDPTFASSFSEIYQAPSLQTQWYAGLPVVQPANTVALRNADSQALASHPPLLSFLVIATHTPCFSPCPCHQQCWATTTTTATPTPTVRHSYPTLPHPPPPSPFRFAPPLSRFLSPPVPLPPAVLGNHDYHRNPDAQTDPALRQRDPRWRCEKTYTVVRDTCPKFRYCESALPAPSFWPRVFFCA